MFYVFNNGKGKLFMRLFDLTKAFDLIYLNKLLFS